MLWIKFFTQNRSRYAAYLPVTSSLTNKSKSCDNWHFSDTVIHLLTHQIIKETRAGFQQLLRWWNEEQTRKKERAKRKLCKLNFTSSAKLKNLLFWSPGLRVALLTSSRPICEPTSQDQIPALNSHLTLGANSQNALTILTKTTPRNSADPILSAGQVGPDAPHRHKMGQEIGRTPRKQPGKSINHYSRYKWSIQIDNKSVNGQHTRSLECIRGGGNQPAEQREALAAESSTFARLH